MGHPSPPDEWVEQVCRRYPTNVLAASALGMSADGFRRMCHRKGIKTPKQIADEK